MRPKDEYQAKSRELRYDSVVSAAAEEGVIRLLLLDPELAGKTGKLSAEEFSSPFLGGAFPGNHGENKVRARYKRRRIVGGT